LLRQGVQPNMALIDRKLALYEIMWTPDALKNALRQVRTDWERDLRPLLPQFLPYEPAREAVEGSLAFI
jgi:hypothetical protein